MPAATSKPASKPRRPPARNAKPRPRARRSSATWRPRLPLLEQRHVDLLGLALVTIGVFLAFPLYAGWDAGRGGRALVDGLAIAFGEVRYLGPVAFAAAGVLLVMRPVLPTLRPFRAGGLCLLGAAALALAAGTFGLGSGGPHDEVSWARSVLEHRGGGLGEALYWCVSSLLGTVGAHTIAIFLFLAAALLLTGGTVAGALQATASAAADTTRALRPPAPRRPRASREAQAAPDAVAEPPDESPFADAYAEAEPIAPPEDAGEDIVIRPGQHELDGAVRYPEFFDGTPVSTDPDDLVEPTIVDRRPPPEPPVDEHDEPDPPEPEPDPEPDLAPGEQGRLEVDPDIAWERPAPKMLTRSAERDARPDTAAQAQTAHALTEALSHFGIDAKVIGQVAGPHITRYELRLAPGVKMSKVANLKDDLAYALAATEIRILAPIPGKTAVGVEVPNKRRQMVTLGDVYGGPPPGSTPLTVWLGKDVSGAAIHADLAKMPHLLVAGTTGAGKSGCVNAMLSSILLRATPTEVRLVLVDPKQVELNHYEAVPHLLTPVITSPRSAANALQNLVREMEWRYGIMSMARTRSLPELNRHRADNGDEPLPYILCVIDELADLMMVAPADVEDSIIRIAQKARAVGIHLVLATQSPRVDVITGMIKANVPSRIAFAVSSQTDSRVILDQNGAESLLGMGDMLFSPVGSSKLQRIQGAFIDEGQIARLTEWWAGQGEPEIREDLLEEVVSEDAASERPDDELDPDEDPLLGEAVQLVVEMETASTSMLQRRLRLGYTRAGRLIDMLERRGVISGYEGSKPRQVLIGAADLPRVLAAINGSAAAAADAPEDVQLPADDAAASDAPAPDG